MSLWAKVGLWKHDEKMRPVSIATRDESECTFSCHLWVQGPDLSPDFYYALSSESTVSKIEHNKSKVVQGWKCCSYYAHIRTLMVLLGHLFYLALIIWKGFNQLR